MGNTPRVMQSAGLVALCVLCTTVASQQCAYGTPNDGCSSSMHCHSGVCVPDTAWILDQSNQMPDKQVFRDSTGRLIKVVDKNPPVERSSYLHLASQLRENSAA